MIETGKKKLEIRQCFHCLSIKIEFYRQKPGQGCVKIASLASFISLYIETGTKSLRFQSKQQEKPVIYSRKFHKTCFVPFQIAILTSQHQVFAFVRNFEFFVLKNTPFYVSSS